MKNNNQINKKIILFDTNLTEVYYLQNKQVSKIKEEKVFFNETLVNSELLEKIDATISKVSENGFIPNNKNTRLYAIGIFQQLSKEEKMQIIIYVYVKHGLYFNIIDNDLEKFYISNNKNNNIVEGIVKQEFRKVVICGSFQKNMKEIEEIINMCKKRNIEVLSPWTMSIVPESLGTNFILLEGQVLYNERDAWRHKYDHMRKFMQADAIIVCNPEGRIGQGTMFEFGYMIGCLNRIIFMNEPKDLSILFPYEIGLNFDN